MIATIGPDRSSAESRTISGTSGRFSKGVSVLFATSDGIVSALLKGFHRLFVVVFFHNATDAKSD